MIHFIYIQKLRFVFLPFLICSRNFFTNLFMQFFLSNQLNRNLLRITNSIMDLSALVLMATTHKG